MENHWWINKIERKEDENEGGKKNKTWDSWMKFKEINASDTMRSSVKSYHKSNAPETFLEYTSIALNAVSIEFSLSAENFGFDRNPLC